MIALLERSRSYGYEDASIHNGSTPDGGMQWGCNTKGLSCNKMFGATCFALLVEEILGGP